MPNSTNLIEQQIDRSEKEQHSAKRNDAEQKKSPVAKTLSEGQKTKKVSNHAMPVRDTNTSKLAVFFRSSGIINGIYLPSKENKYQGILMTEEGLFPATCGKDLMRFLKRIPKRKAVKRKHHFIVWILGLTESPRYRFHLISRTGKKNLQNIELFPRNNSFVAQGIVTDRTSERIMLRVQKNVKPNVTREEIENSLNYLEVRGCPGKVRNSQFWLLRTTLKDGFLQYQSGELLANAKEVKKFLKQP